MKKIFSTIVILIALLAMTTGAAFAGSALELVEVRNDDGQPKFVFRVTGEFSKEELERGSVSFGGKSYDLFCAQTAPDTVVCHTSKAVAGHEVVVVFGGASFWGKVPEQAPAGGGTQYCYPVWSWSESTGFLWTQYGPLCQGAPASAFDWSQYFSMPENPAIGYDVEFYAFDISDFCLGTVPYTTPAYYSPACPSDGSPD